MYDAPFTPPTQPHAGSAVPGPPVAPPADPRPGSVGESRPRPVSVPPTDAVPGPPLLPIGAALPSAVDPVAGSARGGQSVRSSRRSARTFVAFLAGAGIAAGSFGLGAVLTNDDPAPEQTQAAPTPISGALSEDDSSPSLPTPVPLTNDPVANVAAVLGPSVLQVETNQGLGSGVVYDDGLILTNHHVIAGSSQIRVRTSDGRTFDAELLGSDERNDIAVLSIGAGSGPPVADLGNGDDLTVGQLAVAIGSPFELSQTVTAGIVSALNRPVANTAGGFNAMIQTDAPINPGNSGGALANSAGQVIGINTSIRTDGTSNGNLGIGFAVPIDTALGVAQRITSGASLEPGVLGVMSPNTADNEVGVTLGEVVEGGAAEVAGLLSGDRVLTIDGAPVTNFGEVVGLVQSNFAGDEVEITVIRAGETLTFTATLS